MVKYYYTQSLLESEMDFISQLDHLILIPWNL